MIEHLDLVHIDDLTGGKFGCHDAPCPLCGPTKRARVNQRRKVLRIWRLNEGFASYHCARCGEKGTSRSRSAFPPDREAVRRAQAEAAAREVVAAAERLEKANWLWSQRQPIAGTDAETYLRAARGYGGPLPGTLGFLRGRGDHPPAMIAAFGIPSEPEPGVISMPAHALRGVHITRLAPRGHGKAGTDRDKIMIGRSLGWPIVLAPPNDLLGIAIAEGIEDALSVHEPTGLGAWAAGAASRLPALVTAIPSYIETATIMVDGDRDGRRYAGQLARLVEQRGIETRPITLPHVEEAA
ncbi:toprim domain-containing protein [Bradyrhizobium sp. AZCC 2289]|uniref:toprim domain-containing protein n=1 Tax=Bradyrhizobium sp. AZCC 2289 TaxID=3117026 RepID=UPI002FF2AF41